MSRILAGCEQVILLQCGEDRGIKIKRENGILAAEILNGLKRGRGIDTSPLIPLRGRGGEGGNQEREPGNRYSSSLRRGRGRLSPRGYPISPPVGVGLFWLGLA